MPVAPVETLPPPGSTGGQPLPKVAGPETPGAVRATPQMDKAKSTLRGLAGVTDPAKPAKPAAPATPTPPKAKIEPKPEAPLPGDDDDDPAVLEEQSQTPPAPAKEEKGKGEGDAPKQGTEPEGDPKKESPWRLLKTVQAQNANLVREITALKASDNAGVLEATTKKLEAAESRLKELESEMRYVDYSKSAEFAEKYKKPLDAAWAAAAADLSELTITGEDGVGRKATLNDLVALANMPLGEASKVARDLFGDVATEVMAHRRKIIELDRQGREALETARKDSESRNSERSESSNRIRSETRQLFTQAIVEEESKRPFLQEKEGDAPWNKKLAESKSFVEEAFTLNPHDPKLSTAERKEVIRKHAALRNRAIGFSMRGIEINRLNARIKGLEAELSAFQGSRPPTTTGTKPNGDGTISSGDLMERSKADLRSRAR